MKLYTTQRTHTRTLVGSKTMSASLPYMLSRDGGGVMGGIALVMEWSFLSSLEFDST